LSKILTFLVLSLLLCSNASAWSGLLAFGDSFTDNGNLYALTNGQIPASPPNWYGRFSNGPVWVEYLPSELNDPDLPLLDYAVGGAESGDIQLPPGLTRQVTNYFVFNATVEPNDLVIVFIGTNDYNKRAYSGTPVVENDPLVTEVVTNIENAVTRLAEGGAKHFLVPNLPDLSRFPFNTSGDQDSLKVLIPDHNELLATRLQVLRQTLNVTIHEFDSWDLYNQVFTSPQSFGFENVTQACHTGVECANPDAYVFWDSVHPTTAAHDLYAQHVAASLQAASAVSDVWLIY
jgi:phospholipase/lecithinase/hemolysin